MNALMLFSVVTAATPGDVPGGIIAGIILIAGISIAIVYSIPGIGGKICPHCCKYVETWSRKCNYCHERQLTRKNYEVSKRAEQRERKRMYKLVEKYLYDTLMNR